MTDLLKRAPQRTWRPSEARLYFVPVWEFTSFTIGQCNGTSHLGRMALAATALRASPHFRAMDDGMPKQAQHEGRRRAGFDHVVLSTACIEGGQRAAERYGALAPLLKHAVVGRDRAYNAFYAA